MFSKLLGREKTEATADSNKWLFVTMLIFACFSLAAAFALSWEEFYQLSHPNAVLVCDVNSVLSCGAVMKTWQAHLLGFPNSFLGLIAEPVVITVAVAGLAGVKFPRPFMFAAQIFYGLGSLFAYWLYFESLYVIRELCPLCLVVTFSTTLIFESLLRYNIRENNLYMTEKTHKKALKFIQKDYDKMIVAAWLVLLVVLALLKFPNIFG